MSTQPYCVLDDLLLGNVPIPANAQRYVNDAADEIDSVIGFKYETPVVVGNSAEARPVTILLKRLNAWLASGRVLMAVAAPAQDDQIQQYALYLVTQARDTLKMIADGDILLPGAPVIGGESQVNTGPVAAFQDDASAVESFATVFGNPASDVITRVRFPFHNEYHWG